MYKALVDAVFHSAQALDYLIVLCGILEEHYWANVVAVLRNMKLDQDPCVQQESLKHCIVHERGGGVGGCFPVSGDLDQTV